MKELYINPPTILVCKQYTEPLNEYNKKHEKGETKNVWS